MEKEIFEQLIFEGLSTYAISKKLRIGRSRVTTFLKNYGLKTSFTNHIPRTTEQKKAASVKAVSKRRRMLKLKAMNLKGGKCQNCGYAKSIRALQFHHRDPKVKEFRIGYGNTISWDKLRKEIDKCDLLCSNCHAEEHDRLEFINRG